MNSKEKAEEFMSDRCGGTDFFAEEIEELTKLLDQHAEEARAEQRETDYCWNCGSKYSDNPYQEKEDE